MIEDLISNGESFAWKTGVISVARVGRKHPLAIPGLPSHGLTFTKLTNDRTNPVLEPTQT
jgi:hypothetical protein